MCVWEELLPNCDGWEHVMMIDIGLINIIKFWCLTRNINANSVTLVLIIVSYHFLSFLTSYHSWGPESKSKEIGFYSVWKHFYVYVLVEWIPCLKRFSLVRFSKHRQTCSVRLSRAKLVPVIDLGLTSVLWRWQLLNT